MGISAGVCKTRKMALPCCAALTFFCAPRALWECDFHTLRPLHSGNACFDHGVTMLHPAARWRFLYLMVPMLGGAVILICCNTFASAVQYLLTHVRMIIPMLAAAITMLCMLDGVGILNSCNTFRTSVRTCGTGCFRLLASCVVWTPILAQRSHIKH